MNILIVGGSGLIGGEIALFLHEKGHKVTIMSRNPPAAFALKDMDYMQGNYVDDVFQTEKFSQFDCMVFAAAADIRFLPQGEDIDEAAFYKKMNTLAVPKFFKNIAKAGVKRAIYIGSFYPQVAPEQIEKSAYVASRHDTDEAVRALNSDSFTVMSLNAPFVLGHLPGFSMPFIDMLAAYAKGHTELPVFAPEGGTNHITANAIAYCVNALLTAGEPAKAYLIGDENLSWKAYLEMWFEFAGNPQNIPIKNEEHPLFPNSIMYAGAGATVHYDMQDTELLSFPKNQLRPLIKKIIESVD